MVVGNFLDSNCTHSIKNRRAGGTAHSRFVAHIQLDFIYGTRTLLSHNVFVGTTQARILQDNASSNVVMSKNVDLGTPFPLSA